MSSAKELLKAIVEGKDYKEAFKAALSERISGLLEMEKEAVARKLFSSESKTSNLSEETLNEFANLEKFEKHDNEKVRDSASKARKFINVADKHAQNGDVGKMKVALYQAASHYQDAVKHNGGNDKRENPSATTSKDKW